MPRRILIVDDNTIIRRSIRYCIEQNTDWEVCGEAENGRLAVEQFQQLQPDLVILDWQMPVMNGLEAAREIHRIAPSTTMLMLTLHDFGSLRQEAQAVGIREVLSKTDQVSDRLLASLQKVHCA
jgi:two-component system, NarL family, response regulator NreC